MHKKGSCTTLFNGAVIKLSFWVSGVTPGSVLVPIWVTTIVLRQVGIRMCPWVYPKRSHKCRYLKSYKLLIRIVREEKSFFQSGLFVKNITILGQMRCVHIPFLTGDAFASFADNTSVVSSIFMVAV